MMMAFRCAPVRTNHTNALFFSITSFVSLFSFTYFDFFPFRFVSLYVCIPPVSVSVLLKFIYTIFQINCLTKNFPVFFFYFFSRFYQFLFGRLVLCFVSGVLEVSLANSVREGSGCVLCMWMWTVRPETPGITIRYLKYLMEN